jgi:FMN phosphatase YigB (HAD superfamily)
MPFPPANSTIELPGPLTPRPEIRLIIFDFDGTLSWLRHGWPGMMCDVFEPLFPPDGKSPAEIRELLIGEILALNGQPSIRQCERLVEMLAERGLTGHDPETYRAEFQRRLDEAIDQRIARIRSGAAAPRDYRVHGIHAFLEHASKKGVELGILSTTVQHRVEEEAELLGIRHYFGKHVYGGTGDPRLFSKRAIFERTLQEEGVPGSQLLSFGDGPVELRDTKALGGLAIGVCSDEVHNGSGLADPHKRAGLLAAGADALIPDYRDAAPLLDYILGR